MMGEQFHLSRIIKKNVMVLELLKLVGKPVNVLQEIFQAKHDTTIGSKSKLLHSIIQSNKIGHIDSTRVGYMLIGRIQVYNGYFSIQVLDFFTLVLTRSFTFQWQSSTGMHPNNTLFCPIPVVLPRSNSRKR